MDIRQFLTKALPERLNAGKITNRRPPEQGTGCIDSETFFHTTGCIRHGCGCTEFLGGPEGGMSQNICCAKCGAEYNNTPFGIHSLHSMYDKIAGMSASEIKVEQDHGLAVSTPPPPPPSEDNTSEEPEKEDLTQNPLLL